MTHMNEYLPERLAANPLRAMESDSDIEAIGEQEHERHSRHGTESPSRTSQRPCQRGYGDELHGEDERDHIAHDAHRDLIRPCHPAPPST